MMEMIIYNRFCFEKKIAGFRDQLQCLAKEMVSLSFFFTLGYWWWNEFGCLVLSGRFKHQKNKMSSCKQTGDKSTPWTFDFTLLSRLMDCEKDTHLLIKSLKRHLIKSSRGNSQQDQVANIVKHEGFYKHENYNLPIPSKSYAAHVHWLGNGT